MKYVPCADSAFRKTSYSCAYDKDCFAMLKTNAGFKRVYDTRDGTTCSRIASACPC